MHSKLGGRSILVVEDEPLIAMEIVDALKTAGAVVTTTFSFTQALILVEHDGLAAAISIMHWVRATAADCARG